MDSTSHEEAVLADTSLMGLPYELRQKILQLLLKAESPIFFLHDQQTRGSSDERPLWPEITYCCRQLHDEGTPLLYSNIVGIRIGGPSDLLTTRIDAHMLGAAFHGPFWPEHPLLSLLDRFSRIALAIRGYYRDGFDNRRSMRQGIGQLVSAIDKRPQWTEISIQVHEPPPQGAMNFNWDPDYNTYILQPMLRLRNRSVVHIQGVEERLASNLRHDMALTGPSDIALLNDMFHLLSTMYDFMTKDAILSRDPVVRRQDNGVEHNILGILWRRFDYGVCEAYETANMSLFRTQRQILIQQLNLLHAWRAAAVFRADPDDFRGTNSSSDERTVVADLVTSTDGARDTMPAFMTDRDEIRRAMDVWDQIPYDADVLRGK